MPVINPATAIVALWVAWLAAWIAAAPFTKRTLQRQPTGARWRYAALQWAGTILLAHPIAQVTVLRPVLPWSDAAGWAEVALAFAGFALAVWARVHLGRNWSAVVTLKDEHTLIRSGPYAITRHPIYMGILTAAAATALLRSSVADAVGFALLATAFVIKARQEERLMDATFGAAYAAYRQDVPMLLPALAPRGR